jgi:hypothetical protein
MSNSRVNAIADIYEASLAATAKAAESVAPEKRMLQVKDGKSHATWLLGHMTNTLGGAVGAVALGKAPLAPKEYQPLFSPDFLGGQPISSDTATYPDWDSIVDEYKKVGAEVVAAIRELSDGDLDGPAKGTVPEPVKDFFSVLGTSLNSFLIHNAYHTGQMALLVAL